MLLPVLRIGRRVLSEPDTSIPFDNDERRQQRHEDRKVSHVLHAQLRIVDFHKHSRQYRAADVPAGSDDPCHRPRIGAVHVRN